MRLRNRPGAQATIESYPQWVTVQPEERKGAWDQVFSNKKGPIHLEIGMGKGRFIMTMAKKYPHINFIGLELQSSVLLGALEKQLEEELPNVHMIRADARLLSDYFEPGEISHIYLNFSDPWPKNRHEKRRLTHARFLKEYQAVLKKDGQLEFKTDNRHLFEFSLLSFSAYPVRLLEVQLDLHAEDCPDNVMTEYEEKFSKKGNKIYRALIDFYPAEED